MSCRTVTSFCTGLMYNEPRPRIGALDTVRGVLILGMTAVHLAMDLRGMGLQAFSWTDSLVFTAVRTTGAGLFLFLSGVTASGSHRNLRRGLLLLGTAFAVTAATLLTVPEAPVRFGILHCMAVCRLLYAAFRNRWDRLPLRTALPVCVLLFAGMLALTRLPCKGTLLLPLGIGTRVPMSDYFPLMPWSAVFLAGTAGGRAVFAGKMPEWFYSLRSPFLERVGRNSLAIYLVHQPVFLLILGFVQLCIESFLF